MENFKKYKYETFCDKMKHKNTCNLTKFVVYWFCQHIVNIFVSIRYAYVKSVPLVRFNLYGCKVICWRIEPRLRFYGAQFGLRTFFIFRKKTCANK